MTCHDGTHGGPCFHGRAIPRQVSQASMSHSLRDFSHEGAKQSRTLAQVHLVLVLPNSLAPPSVCTVPNRGLTPLCSDRPNPGKEGRTFGSNSAGSWGYQNIAGFKDGDVREVVTIYEVPLAQVQDFGFRI